MQRKFLSIAVLAFLVFSFSSVCFNNVLNAQDVAKQSRGAKLLEKLKQKEKKSLDQLWDEVEESIDNEDYESAIPKLEAILKQEDTEEARELLEICQKKAGVEKWSDGTKAGERKVVKINGVEFPFVWCPAGTFTMGASEDEEGRFDDETQHQVTLTKGFWMMETEVTQKQWKAVMGSNPSRFEGDDLPVENVSWNDCQEFCKKCTQLGFPVQLPTEAQWEYACRAGTTGAYAGNLDEMTWYYDNSDKKTHPVGTKKSNTWGMYDMHGNVWEWCADRYDDYPGGSVTDPAGPSNGSSRVIRGGGWLSNAQDCRSAGRYGNGPGRRGNDLGFRVVRGQ